MKKFEVGKRYVWRHGVGVPYVWECLGREKDSVRFRNCTFGGVIVRPVKKALDLRNVLKEAVKIIPSDKFSWMDVDDELV